MTITNRDYTTIVEKLRRNSESYDAFCAAISSYEQFGLMMEKINENNTKWGKAVGLIGKKEETSESKLSAQEQQWKDYFHNHSFPSPEEQRNFADAMAIVTGIDMGRFLRVIKSKRVFSKCLCIVPTHNNNGHNYRIGKTIFNFNAGLTFFKETGESGNQMSNLVSDYRLATEEEIEAFLLFFMFRRTSACEELVYHLLDNKASEDDE